MAKMDLINREVVERAMAHGACGRISPSSPPITTVILREHATFLSPEADEVRLGPGEYTVAVTAERHMRLGALDGHREVRLQAFATWHDFELDAPMALPVGDRDPGPQIVLMVPGGRALIAPPPVSGQGRGMAPLPVVIDAVLAFLPLAKARGYPINRNIFRRAALSDVVLDPSPTPTGFEPMSTPPDWQGAKVVADSGWQQAAPDAPSRRQERYRADFPDYYAATDTVRVISPRLRGRPVRLCVKSWTVYLRVSSPVLFGPADEIWEDEYHVVADADGNATFPGVIVATAHAPSFAPPPGTTWAAIAAHEFTPHGSIGACVELAVSLHGIATLKTRVCHFNARAPGQPRLMCL
jgi:hypothetical protein